MSDVTTQPILFEFLLDGCMRLQCPLHREWQGARRHDRHARRELTICAHGTGFVRGEEIEEGKDRNGVALDAGSNPCWGGSIEMLADGLRWLVTKEPTPLRIISMQRLREREAVNEVERLKTLMTKQYQDDRRAERVRDQAQEILERWQRKHGIGKAGDDEWCAAMADLANAFGGDEPAVSWEIVKAEIDEIVEIDALRDRIGKLKEEISELLKPIEPGET